MDTPPPDVSAEPLLADRRFPAANAGGGLVAAVGLLLLTGAGLVTTLPGLPTSHLFTPWLVWLLRLAPLPALVLLWAVVNEAHFRVRTDSAGIRFRRGLSGVVRLPWCEVIDYFADCGRSLQDVAASSGSLVADAPDPGQPAAPPPFARYGPDYTVLSGRETFVFDDSLANVGVLAAEVVRHAPSEAPRRWEEASWVTCGRCGDRTAVSLRPQAREPVAGEEGPTSPEQSTEAALPEPPQASPPEAGTGGAEPARQAALACPTCGESLAEISSLTQSGLEPVVRGATRRGEPRGTPLAFPT